MLKTSQEYKFQLEDSVFYANKGDYLKVHLSTGAVYGGKLVRVIMEWDEFYLEVYPEKMLHSLVSIKFKDVTDISLMTEHKAFHTGAWSYKEDVE